MVSLRTAGAGLRRWRASTFEALGERNYRILWAGTTLSFLAFMMSWIVQSVVAFDLTGKNGAVGLVSLGMGVSTILVSPFGGAIADRMSKRRLLLIGQTTIGASFFGVGILILTDVITIWMLVASTFVMGLVFSFIAPARQAWVGDLLAPRLVPNGIALTQVAMTGTRIIGPMVAALFISIAFIGTGGAYVFMGLIFVGVVATLAKLPPTPPRPQVEGSLSVLGDLGAGWKHLQERPRLQLLAYSFILVVIAGYSYQVILPGFLENELGRDAEDLGILMSASAVTGLAVTIGVAGLAGSRFAWPVMFGGGALLGGALIVLSIAPGLAIAIVAMLMLGAGTGVFQMLNNALVMQEAEPAYYGRVMSLTMLAWGFNGLAGLPFGLLADGMGERGTLLLMGSGVLIVTAAAMAIYSALTGRPRPAALPGEASGDAVGVD